LNKNIKNNTPFTGIRHLCRYNVEDDLKSKPTGCKTYPFEHRLDEPANTMAPRHMLCQFYDPDKENFKTVEELLKVKEQQEIADYCIQCGLCCYLLSNKNLHKFGMVPGTQLNWSKYFVDKEYHLAHADKCEHLILENELGKVIIEKVPKSYMAHLYEDTK